MSQGIDPSADKEHSSAVTPGSEQFSIAPRVAAPAMARAVQATENVWGTVESEFGLLSSSEVDTLLRERHANQAFAGELRKRGELLAGLRKDGYVFPGFQVDQEAGAVRPWVAPLLASARANERSAADVIMWMMSPTTYFEGHRPADHVDDAPRLLDVARRAWGIEW